MKRFNFSETGLSSLSPDELKGTNGGWAWAGIPHFRSYVTLLTEAILVEPMKAFGHGLTKGLAAGIK